MDEIKNALDELVAEGVVERIHDEQSGCTYYFSVLGASLASVVQSFIMEEAAASVALDRDDEVGTFSIG